MEEEILRVEQLEKIYDGQKILKGISFDVKKGEFVTILGPSGCGKTTTIRIIAGLTEADAGRVWLEGEDVSELEPNLRAVNTVFQNYALFPHMNVANNIAYGLKLQKMPKDRIRQEVTDILHLVQLDGHEKRRISQLSGGQKQRVAIARALVNKPKVLLLDEPLGALDLKLRRQMQVELKQLQKDLQITCIYITHDQEEARYLSDRVMVMNQGVLEQIGPTEEVFENPANAFVMDFLDVKVKQARS